MTPTLPQPAPPDEPQRLPYGADPVSVVCGCGRYLITGEGSRGASLACRCGGLVKVPEK